MMTMLGLSVSGGAQAIEVGDHAPCTVLRDLQPDGKEIQQCVSTKSEKTGYLLLEFFSITCGPCLDNMPTLSKLATEIQTQATTRIAAIDRNEQDIRSFLQNNSKSLIHFPLALDTNRDAKRAYQVTATPTLFIIDSHDQVVYKHIGTMDSSDVEEIKQIVSH